MQALGVNQSMLRGSTRQCQQLPPANRSQSWVLHHPHQLVDGRPEHRRHCGITTSYLLFRLFQGAFDTHVSLRHILYVESFDRCSCIPLATGLVGFIILGSINVIVHRHVAYFACFLLTSGVRIWQCCHRKSHYSWLSYINRHSHLQC